MVRRCSLEVPAESKLLLHSHGCLSNHHVSAHDEIIFSEGEKAKLRFYILALTLNP
jgi:hypothetical protein